MFRKLLTGAAAVVALCALTASVRAQGGPELILEVDLSVPNQVTVRGMPGLAAGTVSGSDLTGAYLADYYDVPSTALTNSTGTGNLTNFLNPPDGSPGIFTTAGDAGLNIWTWSTDSTVDFQVGVRAFTGAGTWTVTPAKYAELLSAVGDTGDVFFPRDTPNDPATLIGTWQAVVPEPTTASVLIGLTGLSFLRRRR